MMLVAFQLGLTGLHELSEAQWLPSSKGEMAILGPVVRNELFFFVFIFGAAILLILREWQTASQAKIDRDSLNAAEKRLFESQNRRQRGWMLAAATASLAVILVLTADFIYARANSAPPAAQPVDPVGNIVRVPVGAVQDGAMHLFTVSTGSQSLRFMVIKKPNGWGVALDACRICGAEGYRQDGQNVICRHCASAIYIPSIGDQGGCNPIGVPAHVDQDNIVIDISALAQESTEIPK
ncbi:MAG: hypothetical protein DMG40_06080 [Acidobacteria bacterium]|nr:MAG: hypothetical protein DMG40_06080 [Acidobacteriota bacterium]